jgi:hypothetical protein
MISRMSKEQILEALRQAHKNRDSRYQPTHMKRYWADNIKRLEKRLQEIRNAELLASKNLGNPVVKDNEVTSS